MRYRKLGNSDLAVSEIALGSWLTFAGGVAAEQTRTPCRSLPRGILTRGGQYGTAPHA
jgi:aryl-alcohol dehydrogenase-like predicted oxidoreductase